VDESTRVLIAVCSYNEAENIVEMLDRLRAAIPCADLLVVDDDSPDGTARLANQWSSKNGRCQVIVREGQRGLGGAIRRAIEHAVADDYRFFLNLDADLSHDPAELVALLDAVASDDDVDVAIGSRYVDGGSIVGWPLRRKLMSRTVNAFAVWVLGLPVRDCSGSMRCYRVTALAKMDLASFRNNGYALLEELLVMLKRSGATMIERPICFTERQAGHSKLTTREAITSAIAIARLRR